MSTQSNPTGSLGLNLFELGIITFFTGAAHVYLSMFPLARRGPFGFYQSWPVSAYAGLAGLVIMFTLLLLSNAAVARAITQLSFLAATAFTVWLFV